MARRMSLLVLLAISILCSSINSMESNKSILDDALTNFIQSNGQAFPHVIRDVIVKQLWDNEVKHFIDIMLLKFIKNTNKKDIICFNGARLVNCYNDGIGESGETRPVTTFIDKHNCLYRISEENVVEKIFELPAEYKISYYLFSQHGLLFLSYDHRSKRFALWDTRQKQLLKEGNVEDIQLLAHEQLHKQNIADKSCYVFLRGFECKRFIYPRNKLIIVERDETDEKKTILIKNRISGHVVKKIQFNERVIARSCSDKYLIIENDQRVILIKLFNNDHVKLKDKLYSLMPVEKFFIYLLYRLHIGRFECCKHDKECMCAKTGYNSRHKIWINTSEDLLGKIYLGLDDHVKQFLKFAFRLDILENNPNVKPIETSTQDSKPKKAKQKKCVLF